MARYTGPRNRLARREGLDLGLKTHGSKAHASLLRRLNVPPGMHGAKGKRKSSDFGLQLREKQKAKRIYSVLERQFQNYFKDARKVRGNTGEALLQHLELRLDNVLYRLALAPTRAGARQLISHGHVQVNGKKMSYPSYEVKVEDVVTFKPKGLGVPSVKKLIEEKNPTVPVWLARQGAAGKVIKIPQRTELTEEINEQLIVEFYSR